LANRVVRAILGVASFGVFGVPFGWAQPLPIAPPVVSVGPTSVVYLDVDGDDLALPVPAGFCPPSRVPTSSSTTGAEQTHILPRTPIYRCKGIDSPPGAPIVFFADVKNPTQKLNTTREDFIKSMLSSFRSPSAGADVERGFATGSHGVVIPGSVNFQSPVVDINGLYLMTHDTVKTGNEQVELTEVAGLTLTKGYVVGYAVAAKAGPAVNNEALLLLVEEEARRLVEINDRPKS
jgi:hypothetical protein